MKTLSDLVQLLISLEAGSGTSPPPAVLPVVCSVIIGIPERDQIVDADAVGVINGVGMDRAVDRRPALIV